MTPSKSSADLTAIYNLKFYRKQNCWKLNAPIRKKNDQIEKLSTSSKHKLNETYLISDKVQNESPETHPLNIAFLEPEREHVVSDPKQVLSLQWLEPLNIWPKSISNSEENVPSGESVETNEIESQQGKNNKKCIHERLKVLLNAAKEHEDEKLVSALDNEGTKIFRSQENMSDIFISEDEHILQNWLPLKNKQTVWSEPSINPVDFWLDHDVIDGLNYSNQVRSDGDWDNLLYNHPSSYSEFTSVDEALVMVDVDGALDSSSEFMRGAHNAPHSSEIDFALPPEFMFGTLSQKVLRNMNTRQLAQAVSEHSAMMVQLMTDKGKRSESYDEYPTRDVGPFPNGDEFVAGSHPALSTRDVNNGLVGRGRGRLIQNRLRY